LAGDPNTPRPFDVETIKFLVRLMSRHDLSEIDLHEGDRRIRLRRGPTGAVTYAPVPLPVGPAAHAPAAQPGATTPAPAAEPARKLHEIKSEFVGTFYSRPKPEAEPFIKVGSKLKPDTVVGLIEAMKLYNDVPAGCTGVVAEVVVEDKQPVEFNTVLFRVELTS
jgi:acetyl-CoA carboxylase biotin carboxyl carrier protein